MSQEVQPELSLDEYRRYGRQMIINELGLPAQKRLLNASVIVVGAGGLGCPALQYLCAAGVGHVGIVDHDIVELSNLQRQVLHTEETIGMPKVDSAAQALRRMNSKIHIETYKTMINSENAQTLLAPYDVVLDCTDNAPARYLLSDTCVALGKPLVSGAAQRLEGQLCVYNSPLKPKLAPAQAASSASSSSGASEVIERGPCYRCLFPRPPAPDMVAGCDETGILGAVTGVIGTMQALEAIRLITGLHNEFPTLHIYSALAFPLFRSVKLRARRRTCPACGVEGERLMKISELDYVAFCGGPRPDWVKKGLEVADNDETSDKGQMRKRIRARELYDTLFSKMNSNYRGHSVRIFDVRSRVEFGICHLPNSINIPLPELVANPSQYLLDQPQILIDNIAGSKGLDLISSPDATTESEPRKVRNRLKWDLTVLVCRLGNDSQIGAEALRTDAAHNASGNENSYSNGNGALLNHGIVDLVGGLRSWAQDVDPSFPVY